MAEIASAYVSLIPAFRGGGAKIAQQLAGPVDSAGKSSGKRFGNAMSGGIGSVGKKIFAPLAAVAAGAGIASFFKGAVAGASDLNETASKVTAIFGAGTAAVNKFADQGAKALGQTKQEVLDASATFGTFGKAAGLSGADLAKFSTGFAGLSTDMASFGNTSPETAVQAIGAALRGESEPIRQFGVLLDDATLRTEALKLGLIKTTKQALTPQQKVLAAQAAIYKQTKDAQGDFARTSGGLANQQRILKAQFTDMKTTIGSALLPIVVKAVTAFNGLFDQIKSGSGPLNAIKGPLGWITAGVLVFVDALRGKDVTNGGVLGTIGDVAYGIRDAFNAALPVVRQFVTTGLKSLAVAGKGIMKSLAPVLKALPGLFAELLPVLTSVGKTILSVFKSAFTKIGPLVATVAGVVIDLFNLIAPAVQQLVPVIGKLSISLQGMASTLVAAFAVVWPPIKNLIAGIMAQLVPGLKAIFTVVSTQIVPALQSFATAIAPIIAWLVNKLAPVVVTVFGVVVKVIKIAMGIIANVIKLVTSVIKGDWSGAWDAIKGILSGVWDAIKTVVTGGIKIVKSLIATNIAIIKVVWGRAWDGIKAAVAAIWVKIQTVVSGGITKLKTGVSTGFASVVTFIEGIPGKIVTAMGDIGSLLLHTGENIVQGLIDGIGNMGSTVATFVTQFIKDHIPGPIAHILGIESPSKLMASMGKQIPAGLIEGIGSQQRKVDDTMRKLVDPDKMKLKMKMSGAGSVPLPGAGGAGGKQYNLTYTGAVHVTDHKEFKRKENARLRDLVSMADLRGGV